MEKLLQMAMDAADQAEVFFREKKSTSLAMRNGSVTETSTSMISGYSLRMIRNGVLGTACSRNLTDRRDIVSNAVASLRAGWGPDIASLNPTSPHFSTPAIPRSTVWVTPTSSKRAGASSIR